MTKPIDAGEDVKLAENCKYNMAFYDHKLGDMVLFDCEEEAIKDGLCIFHHPTYWKEHQDKVRFKFYEKIQKSLEREGKLICIGYNIPKIDLYKIELKIPTYFSRATFHQKAVFYEVKFLDIADFSNARFSGDADFSSVRFVAEADFSNARFSGDADFSSVRFLAEADFSEARFSGDADFWEVIFTAYANFWKAIFTVYADFLDTRFLENADFLETRFLNDADFSYSIFLGNVCFSSAKFSTIADFTGVKFLSGFPLIDLNITKCVEFEETFFEKPEMTLFNDVDINKISFLDTDISRVRFMNIEWDEYYSGYIIYECKIFMLKRDSNFRRKYLEQILDRLSKLRNNEDALKEKVKTAYCLNSESNKDELNKKFEEVKSQIDKSLKMSWVDLEKNLIGKLEEEDFLLEDITFEDVLNVYRFLRENYDYYLRYEESGRFFIGEMELIRLSKGLLERVVLTLYRWLCLYGESYLRPALLSLTTIIGFAIIDVGLKILSLEAKIKPSICIQGIIKFTQMFMESIKTSVVTFLQMHLELKSHIIIERILSIMILGSLYISLKRKLERRIRH